jgi:hypothetical protein
MTTRATTSPSLWRARTDFINRAAPRDFSYCKSASSGTSILAEPAESVVREKPCPMLELLSGEFGVYDAVEYRCLARHMFANIFARWWFPRTRQDMEDASQKWPPLDAVLLLVMYGVVMCSRCFIGSSRCPPGATAESGTVASRAVLRMSCLPATQTSSALHIQCQKRRIPSSSTPTSA